MDYFEHMEQRLKGSEQHVPGWLGRKDEVREFARFVGVRTPAVYYVGPLAQLPVKLPERFVIKPEFASTSIGVMLIERVSSDAFVDAISKQEFGRADLIGACQAVAEKFFSEPEAVTGAKFIIEELLVSRDGSFPPPDVRCYAFQGEIGMILTEHHFTGPARAMYFDGDFHPFEDLEARYGVAAGAETLEQIVPAIAPLNASKILKVSRRISAAVPSAFCRIDLYDTPKGITLGELTFFPGTFYYRNRKVMHQLEAERLGRLWDSALDRLDGSQ